MKTFTPNEVFSKCVAVSVATNAKETEAVGLLATKLGFHQAVDLHELNAIETTALTFYFVHHRLPDSAKLRFLGLVRALSDPNRKFAPVVLLLSSGPKHLSIQYIEMGFDEVVFLNDPLPAIANRLAGQIGRDLIYVETEHYLGPDRRRVELIDRKDPRRTSKGGDHTELSVFRDPSTGIRIERRL